MSYRFFPYLLVALFSFTTHAADLPSTSLRESTTQQAGAEGHLINQTSKNGFDLSGMSGGAYARWKPADYLNGGIRVGSEAFWKGKVSKDGFYGGAFGQYSFNSHMAVRADITYHDALHDYWEGDTSLNVQQELTLWKFGVRRELIYDSYTSLLGVETNKNWVGAARKNMIYASARVTFDRAVGDFRAYFGNVIARPIRTNPLYGVDGSYAFNFKKKSAWSLVSKGEVWVLQHDDGGLAGYYSPTRFIGITVLMRYQKEMSSRDNFTFEIGPQLQMSTGSNLKQKSQGGGWAAMGVSKELDPNFQIQLQGQAYQLTEVYTQVQGMLYLHRLF